MLRSVRHSIYGAQIKQMRRGEGCRPVTCKVGQNCVRNCGLLLFLLRVGAGHAEVDVACFV